MQMALGLRQAKLIGHAAAGAALCPALAHSWNGACCTSSIETQDAVALKVGQSLHCKHVCERTQKSGTHLQAHMTLRKMWLAGCWLQLCAAARGGGLWQHRNFAARSARVL